MRTIALWLPSFSEMFRTRHARHRFHRFGRFGRFQDIGGFGGAFGSNRSWTGGSQGSWRRTRGPTAVQVLLAGLAVFAFGKLLSAINRPNRSTAEKLGLGALLAMVGVWLLSYRNPARRYHW